MGKSVLLIDPPMQKFMDFSKSYIPLGLLYIGANLEKYGNSVNIYDADYNPNGKSLPFTTKMSHYSDYLIGLDDQNSPIWGQVRNVIERCSPDIVGISVISPKLYSGFRVAEIAKQMGVGKVVMGGPHASIDPEEVIENHYVDAVVVGEAENGAIVRALNGEKGIIRSPAVNNLDDLPWPSRSSLVDIGHYRPNDLSMVMTSRGCPNACNFCCSDALWGRTVRFRSIEDVVHEIDSIAEEFKSDDFYVIDDTFSVRKNRVEEFSRLMSKNDYTWSCLTRANKVDDEIASMMKKSGCRLVKIGLESGNEDVLLSMNKRSNLDTVRKASESLKNADLPWVAYLMFGTPNESRSQREDTKKFVEEVEPTFVSPSVFTPYPGTVFYEELGLQRMEYHKYNHHNPKGNPDISEDEVMEIAEWSDQYNSGKRSKSIS